VRPPARPCDHPRARAPARTPDPRAAGAAGTWIFHKPWGVLSRFTSDGSAHRTLAAFDLPKDIWPVGRLDADSEGLLVLSGDKALVDRLLNPRHQHPRTYWVQVERIPTDDALARLTDGSLSLDGRPLLPARVARIEAPPVGPRDPPIRFRKSVPDCWLSLTLTEGRNRQVRRMTAAVGFPTLRLIRQAVGPWRLDDLQPGQWRELTASL
jgi:23S rRNA pseudouridine2457 synthase